MWSSILPHRAVCGAPGRSQGTAGKPARKAVARDRGVGGSFGPLAGQRRGAEHALEIEGRHLQVGFVATRYQGQDVRLCAFNDVTRHVEDARALEDARRTAAAANEAKTLFLATMSHEIRTPLYGVLGTLELLGLTPLAPRQQAYLQTIQRSSATLFQLISDVLDVSKIESGQMALEPVEFCPLEMIEDTLRTYSAFAQRKGLLLYGCTDARLPQRVFGDPIRIRQILNNLLSNAIKFTDSGRVVLRTRVFDCAEGQVHGMAGRRYRHRVVRLAAGQAVRAVLSGAWRLQ